MPTTAAEAYRTISNHDFALRKQHIVTGQNALFSLKSFDTGDNISNFYAGSISSQPTYLTIQTGFRKHITLEPDFLQYTNHSCSPNVFFDTQNMQLIALKPIALNDELSFFYPSTEWKMSQAFSCNCGSPICLGIIKGAAYLSAETLFRYRLTGFISSQLAKRVAKIKCA